ncbi:MAG TPA: penicillin acylase family protein [Vicinamibacterales bacterium]|nr:penicillin acylase family protein [Vicinamibacterales bacterium]
MFPAKQFVGPAFAVLGLVVLSMWPAAQTDDRINALARASLSQINGELAVPGLSAQVEVVRDTWGVPHIYARNIDDLFMAQGYVMAQDRLWQMEMWRRQAEGRMAEILGPQAVQRDRIARQLKFRGPFDDREWTSYHPDGKRIFTAYAAGVNAYIRQNANNLPLEFKLTGITPEPWTAETLLLRAGTFGDASAELMLARNVVRLGAEAANKQRAPDPWDDLKLPEGLDLSIIDEAVAIPGGRGGGGGRGGNQPAIVEPYRSWIGGRGLLPSPPGDEITSPGSNNWVVSGRLSATGKPVVANDPHRTVTNPSLRYISHLVAPGWNVIGASEPPFVGVAVGHNERVAWGLTIAGNDQEDVYVEEVNPANANEVRFRGAWEPIRVVRESIAVKGGAAETVELRFTRHGPIFYEDKARNRAYVLRSALLEPGTAPYIGGLRLAQARDCRQFLDAAMSWKAPTENLICGDVDGNISWQASALTPNRTAPKTDSMRRSWTGRLPVPGTGAYEWEGFRQDLPRELNPARGFVATANNQVQPKDYQPPMMFKSSTNVPFDRITRLLQMVTPDKKYTIEDHRRMQGDTLHLRAVSEIPLFKGWTSANAEVERARALIAQWDGRLDRTSAAAAVYTTWRGLSSAQERDAARSAADRKAQHEASLTRAIADMKTAQGQDWAAWRWGRMHTRAFPHPLLSAFDLPTVERPGGAGSVAADGASYREVLDVADWDRSIVTNVPGQSGQPGSPFYGSLLKLWADDTYFPLAFSRARVDAAKAHTLTLKPAK